MLCYGLERTCQLIYMKELVIGNDLYEIVDLDK